MATTVQNIIDGIAWQADLKASTGTGKRLDPADLIPEIDAVYKEAHELIVAVYEDYAVKKLSSDIVITGGVGLNSYQIVATDFFKIKAIQPLRGTTYGQALEPHTLNQAGVVSELTYRLVDDTIYFEPELSCAGTYRLWYVYTPADLTLVSDTIKDLNGMVKRFCIDAVVLRVVLREEEDSAPYVQLREKFSARISKMYAHRNAGKGRRVQDTRRGGRSFRFMTRSGLSLPS